MAKKVSPSSPARQPRRSLCDAHWPFFSLLHKFANARGVGTELRRRREEAQVEIRKQKREESVAKRRNFVSAASGGESDDDGAVDSAVSAPPLPSCTSDLS